VPIPLSTVSDPSSRALPSKGRASVTFFLFNGQCHDLSLSIFAF
jgi:hypothetical protein